MRCHITTTRFLDVYHLESKIREVVHLPFTCSYTISHLESWIQQNAKYANLFIYLWTSRFTNLLFSNSDQYLLSRIMSKRDMDILARDMANASKWFWYPTCWCSNAIDASIFGLALASRPTKPTKMPHQTELPGCLLAIDVFLYTNHHGSRMISTCPCLGIFKAKLTMQKKGKTAIRVGWAAIFSISCQAKKSKVFFFFLEQMNIWVFPTNRATPKWMVYNGKPYWNGWFGGTTIFGNIHMMNDWNRLYGGHRLKPHWLHSEGSSFDFSGGLNDVPKKSL